MGKLEALVAPGAPGDDELMRRWVDARARGGGDAAAYEALYRRHREAVRGRIAHVLGPHARHLDDVFQDTWLEVARATTWQPVSFRAWVLTMATRKALDRLALKGNAAEVERPSRRGDEEEPAAATLPGREPSPHDVVAARELLEAVRAALAGLPEAQRACWVLRYVEGLAFEEIAARLGIPEGTAKTRVRLAKRDVAAALGARGIVGAGAGGEETERS